MKKVRFIHGADVHLGGRLHIGETLYPEISRHTKEATFKAFENLCEMALDYRVDFVLLSGDLYHREARSVKGQQFF